MRSFFSLELLHVIKKLTTQGVMAGRGIFQTHLFSFKIKEIRVAPPHIDFIRNFISSLIGRLISSFYTLCHAYAFVNEEKRHWVFLWKIWQKKQKKGGFQTLFEPNEGIIFVCCSSIYSIYYFTVFIFYSLSFSVFRMRLI